MTAEAPALPTSRAMAGWMRQLNDRQPLALRFGYFVLHSVEVPLIINRICPLDSLYRQFLTLLNEHDHAMETVRLGSLLGLNHGLTLRLAQTLQMDGLVVAGRHESSTQSTWSVTSAGKQAIKDCLMFRAAYERRVLTFVAGGDSRKSAQFVNINHLDWGVTLTPAAGEFSFNPADVIACIQQNAEWKHRRGFPTDVLEVSGPAISSPKWKHVIIDRPKRCEVLLLQDAKGLHGFALQRPNWSLQSVQPCFTLSMEDVQDCFPGAIEPPSGADWLQAWRQWGQEHGLTTAAMASCTLGPDGTRIRLRSPTTSAERIATLLASDEGWLRAGTAAWQACACLELES